MASKPTLFSSGPKNPAASDSAAVPVKGDFPVAANRQDAAIGEPVMTPVATIRRLSGEKGSIRGESCSVNDIILTAGMQAPGF